MAANSLTIPNSMALPGEAGYRSKPGYTITTPVANPYQNIIDTITKMQTDINAKTKARETEVRGILDEVIGFYRQGGAFGQGVEASLERERTKTLAAGGQSLISSGLYNTTQLAGLSGRFAEEVGAPTRAKLEDLRMDKLSSALGQKAQFVTDITETQPNYQLLAQLQMAGGGAPVGGRGVATR
jgi:hypothetical protein